MTTSAAGRVNLSGDKVTRASLPIVHVACLFALAALALHAQAPVPGPVVASAGGGGGAPTGAAGGSLSGTYPNPGIVLPTGTSNCVVASPANGSSATVACRALVAADIPVPLVLGVTTIDSVVDATNRYGVKITDVTGATNNYAIKSDKGLVEFGNAGDAAGTVGLHISGDGAFTGQPFGAAQLWLDADDDNPYGLVLTNRSFDPTNARFAGFYVAGNGTFVLQTPIGGTLAVNSSGTWNFGGLDASLNPIPANLYGVFVTTQAITVADLPLSPIIGQRAFVTDSNALSFTAGIGAVVAAGGSTKVPVVYDGAAWRIG